MVVPVELAVTAAPALTELPDQPATSIKTPRVEMALRVGMAVLVVLVERRVMVAWPAASHLAAWQAP